jgi:hypothetical protein
VARTPSWRPCRSASSWRSIAISTSRAVTERAITRSASSVAWALYPHSDIGGRSSATSVALTSSSSIGAVSPANVAISPARPSAATTTPARITAAATNNTIGTL